MRSREPRSQHLDGDSMATRTDSAVPASRNPSSPGQLRRHIDGVTIRRADPATVPATVEVARGIRDTCPVVDTERRAAPSGTVTFLFTDIEGSTKLWQSHPDGMSASLTVHDELIRAAIDRHDGYVFATGGDSFAVAFARGSAAVEAAREMQSALATASWPGPELRVRIGLHVGEAEERSGNYFGPAVNTAARVEAAAHGGQTVITEAVRVAARTTGTSDLGTHELRDVEEPVHLHQLGDGDFPALRTLDASDDPAPVDLPRAWIVVRQPGFPPEIVELERELTIGRDVGRPEIAGHLALRGDRTVSRLHGVLTPRAAGWCVQATNATNGLFVNGTRLASGAVHLLAPEDDLRFGERTSATFHTIGAAGDRSSTETARPIPELTPGERRVLVALCSPVLSGDAFTPPATVAAIAEQLVVSESAVKQQLGRLYDKFDVGEGGERRARLANEALACGAVRLADLRSGHDGS